MALDFESISAFYLILSVVCEAGNSDPEKLKEEAADVQKLSADELQKRRQEIKVRNAALVFILW